jgi:hypothetical protein
MRIKNWIRLFTSLMIVMICATQFAPVVHAISNSQTKSEQKNSNKKDNSQKKADSKNDKPTASPATDLNPNYSVEVLQLSTKAAVEQKLDIKIRLTNTSSFSWGGSGEHVKLAYHWVDRNGQYEPDQGVTTQVPKLTKNATKDFTFSVLAPTIPGNFTLYLDPILNHTNWFSEYDRAPAELGNVKITGGLTLQDDRLSVTVNSGQTYTNKAKLNLTYTPVPIPEQISSLMGAFVYKYAQAADSSKTKITSGEALWGKWSYSDNGKLVHVLTDKSVGWKEIFVRFRSIKKQYDDNHNSFGSARAYGRKSSVTTDVYSLNPAKIFFDNVPPTGYVKINGGASTTSSRTGNLNIWATDTIDGVTGSGLAGMRWTVDCNSDNLSANSWSAWEDAVGDKNNVYLGSNSPIKVCVQVKDKASNVATFIDTITYYVPVWTPGGGDNGNVKGIGTEQDPYAGLTGSNFTTPSISFDRFIRWDGAEKWNKLKSASNLQPPVITYAKTASDGSKVQLYGVAIPKNHPVNVEVWNEFRYCWACGSGWERQARTATAQHVKVVIFEVEPSGNWRYVTEFWNDSADGRWQLSLPLNDQLRVGDKVVAEVQVYGEYLFSDLHWWKDTYEHNVVFNISDEMWEARGVPYWGSGPSNQLVVPARWISDPALRAIVAKEDSLGNAVREGELHEWCGFKLMDYTSIGGYGDSILMYNPQHDKAYLLTGGIWWSYYTFGGCGRFGLPLMDEARAGGVAGWYQNFSGASIYWSESDPKAQPGIVQGKIRDYYGSLHGTWSELRMPEREQWGNTSQCGVIGTEQHFQGGKIFSSYYGTYHISYYSGWFDAHNSQGGVARTGWPRGLPYEVSWGYWQWQFENGTLHKDLWNTWFVAKDGCNKNIGRENDPQNSFTDIIRRKEDTEFATFTRANGGAGNGAVHAWSCGGETIWLVDYDEVVLHGGKSYDRSVVMVNGGSAYLMSGPILEFYFGNGGCIFGKPTVDLITDTTPTKYGDPRIDWQRYSNSTLVHDWSGRYVRLTNGQYYRLYTSGVASSEGGRTEAVQGSINNVYATQKVAETDATYVHGYLGVPLSTPQYFGDIVIGGKTISGKYGQQFQGGYIFRESDGSYSKMLDDTGMNKLKDEITVDPAWQEQVMAFISGLATGLLGSFIPETWQDALDMLLEIGSMLFGGPIGAVLNIASFVFGIYQLVAAWPQMSEGLMQVFTSGDQLLILSTIGAIAGGIIGGVLISGLDELFTNIKKVFFNLSELGGIFSKMDLSEAFQKTLREMSSDPAQQTMFSSFIAILKRNEDIMKKITGNFDALSDLDKLKVLALAEKLDDVNVDEVQDILVKMPDDITSISKLDSIQTTGYVAILKKTSQKVDPAIMAKLSNIADLDALNSAQIDNVLDIARRTDVDVAQFKKLVDRIPGGLWDKNYINKLLTDSDETLSGGAGHWYRDHVDVTDTSLQLRALNPDETNLATAFTDELTARSAMLNLLQKPEGMKLANEMLDKSVAGIVTKNSIKLPYASASQIGFGYENIGGNVFNISQQLNAVTLVIKSNGAGGIFILTSYPTYL